MPNESSSPINEDQVFHDKVKLDAERAIAFTCGKHGVTREQINPEHIEDAYRSAHEKLTRERDLQNDPAYQLGKAQDEKIKLLEAQIQGLKNTHASTGKAPINVPKAADVRTKIGVNAWAGLTTDDKFRSIGIDPASVTAATKEQAKSLFGKNSKGQDAIDFFRVNERRYKELREVAEILDFVGK